MFPHDGDAGRALEQRYRRASPRRIARAAREAARLLRGRRQTVALRFRLATCTTRDLADSDRAVEIIAPRSAALAHAGAIRALEKSRRRRPARRRRRNLEPTYVARHDWPAQVRIYQIRLEAADVAGHAWCSSSASRASTSSWISKRVHLVREGLREPSDRRARDQWRVSPACSTTGCGWPGQKATSPDQARSRPTASRCCALAAIYHGRLEDVVAPRRSISACSSSTATTGRVLQSEQLLSRGNAARSGSA